jgi:NADH-quinone oxidoreductase subunit J
MEIVAFLVIALVAVVAAISTILSPNPVHSALFLVVNLFCVAVLYLSLNADFLAIVQVIVYAGAIMVLFLFVITLLNPTTVERRDTLPGQTVLAGILALLLLAETGAAIISGAFANGFPASLPAWPFDDNVRAIGTALYTQYLFPFEATSILLLVAIVGATVLAKRRV